MKNWCRQHAVHLVVTIGALLIATAHIRWPSYQLDYATLTLLVIALLPWLGAIFKSIEFPGGEKVEYREFEKTEEDAVEAGLLKPRAQREPEKPAYAAIAEEDPNLALAGLRIEIERVLRKTAETRGLDAGRKGIGQLMRQLQAMGELTQQQISVLADLVGLLNSAVHGAEIDQRAAKWAVEVGPELISSLQARMSEGVRVGEQFNAVVRKPGE